MGGPRKQHKKYQTPKHPWDKMRIDEEVGLKKKYGLRSKREIWRAETVLRGFRHEARRLQALRGEHSDREEQELMERLRSLNLIDEGATLDDVLRLQLEDVLRRRLQTVVYERGLASTPKQARQFIKHGHIVVKGRKVNVPSYMVNADEEGMVGHARGSTVSEIVIQRPEEAAAKGEAR
jgi:small subunit ribosomal protein S4